MNDEHKVLKTAISRASLPGFLVHGLLFDKTRKRSLNLSGLKFMSCKAIIFASPKFCSLRLLPNFGT